jgi:hypothetical protein
MLDDAILVVGGVRERGSVDLADSGSWMLRYQMRIRNLKSFESWDAKYALAG